MKRFLVVFIIISLLLQSNICYALLTPTGPKSATRMDYINNSTMEARVTKLLKNNIVFVHNSSEAWVYDKKVNMGANAVMNSDKTFSIPSDFARTLGVSVTTQTVSSVILAEKLGMYTFADERGFLMLSKNQSAINQTLTVEGDNSYYFDFYNVAAAIGTVTWDEVTPTEDDYKAYIKNWRALLTVPSGSEEQYASYIRGTIDNAKKLITTLDTRAEAVSPFKDIAIPQNYSTAQYAAFESVYSRIYNMAKGYYLEGCTDDQLKEAVLYAIRLMHDKYYAPGWSDSGAVRWTTFQFLLPYSLSNTLCMMYDVIPQDEMQKYVDAIWDKSVDPTMSIATTSKSTAHYYTNRLWCGISFFNCAILVRDAYRANYMMRYLNQVFDYVNKNADEKMSSDGFYYDGSMVFHGTQAYNMGYGANYVVILSSFLLTTKNTCFDVRKIYNYNNVYDFIKNSFLPFVTRNMKMKMVMGREMEVSAASIISGSMTLLNYAPEDVKADVAKAIKATIGNYTDDYKAVNVTSYFAGYPMYRREVSAFLNYMENSQSNEFEEYNRIYYNMDRVVHEREKFRMGLAMSSSRIEKYEGYNSGLGLNEWYIGDGMTYIYTDNSQYTRQWFDAVDHFYMPGTTVDSTPRTTAVETRNNPNWGLPENDYAGGVSDGKDGAAGMILGNKWVSGLQGRKSWFMFGDEIVCLGSGITGGYGDVYTVVDNRLLSKKGMANPGASIKQLEIKSIKDFTNKTPAELSLIADQNDDTNWRSEVLSSWIEFDFGKTVNLGGTTIKFASGSKRQAIMQFEVSTDGLNYKKVFDGRSSGKTEDFEFFPVSSECRYFRLISLGNSDPASNWITIPEIRFYDGEVDPKLLLDAFNKPTTGYEDFVIDGVKQEVDFQNTHSVKSPLWAWAENHGGYVFLTESDLKYVRKFSSPATPFLITYIDHKNAPKDATYAYALLPKTTENEVKEYAENPNVEIISNTKRLHAVRNKENGEVAANIFEDSEIDGIHFSAPASVLIKQESTGYRVYVSDPTQRRDSMEITFDKPVALLDNNGQLKDEHKVVLDISSRKGETYSLKFTYTSEMKDPQIKVVNYNLKTNGNMIKTTLYAADKEKSSLSFDIYKEPKNGDAHLDKSVLYYTPIKKGNFSDSLTIRVKNEKGTYELFEVMISSVD